KVRPERCDLRLGLRLRGTEAGYNGQTHREHRSQKAQHRLPPRSLPEAGNRPAFPERLKRTEVQRSCAKSPRHHRLFPSITFTDTASRSKSSNRRALTATLGLSKSGLPVDQSGDSE